MCPSVCTGVCRRVQCVWVCTSVQWALSRRWVGASHSPGLAAHHVPLAQNLGPLSGCLLVLPKARSPVGRDRLGWQSGPAPGRDTEAAGKSGAWSPEGPTGGTVSGKRGAGSPWSASCRSQGPREAAPTYTQRDSWNPLPLNTHGTTHTTHSHTLKALVPTNHTNQHTHNVLKCALTPPLHSEHTDTLTGTWADGPGA